MVSETARARREKFRLSKQQLGGADGVIRQAPEKKIWYCVNTGQVRAYGSRADFIVEPHWASADVPESDIQMFQDDPSMSRWIVVTDEYGESRISEREQPTRVKLMPTLTSLTHVANADLVITTDAQKLVASPGFPENLPTNGDLHIAICEKNDPYSVIFNFHIPVFQVRRGGTERKLPFEIDMRRHSLYVVPTPFSVCWEPL